MSIYTIFLYNKYLLSSRWISPIANADHSCANIYFSKDKKNEGARKNKLKFQCLDTL